MSASHTETPGYGLQDIINPGDPTFNQELGINIAAGTYQTVDDPSAVLALGGTAINGINDKGQLVGFYGDANGNTIGLPTNPTPEPPSLVLLGAGMALIFICATRGLRHPF